MKNNNFGMEGWFVRLMMVVCLVVATSGMAAAWNITATSITVPSGKHGRMYFSYVDQYNNTVAGGSLPDGATGGTTRGVPSGSYTLSAFMDTQGTGFQHANDPAFSFPITVSADSGGPAVFTTPAPVATAAPVHSSDPDQSKFDVMPIDSAAFVEFRPDKSNNLPTADRHTIYWSTNGNPGPTETTGGGSLVITSMEPKVVIYNLINGTPYYFAIRAENSVNQPLSAPVGPIVPAASAVTASTVNVQVDTTGITKNNPLTPLIIALSDNNNSTFFSYVKTPVDLQTVPVTGVKNGLYKIYTILDLSGTGNLDDPRNVSNMSGADRNQRPLPIMVDGVSAPITAPTTKLAVKNAGVAVITNHSRQNGADNYSLWFNVAPMSKQLVNVTLVSGPQISGPIDMGMNSNNEKNGSYGLSVQVPNRPAVNDIYNFLLYFADAPATAVPGSAAVTAVLDNFPANNFPIGATGPDSVSPTFSWVNPGNLPGFVTTSLSMNYNGIDFLPMNVLSAKPDGASFPVGQTNYWDRSIQDLDGNQARQSMSFTPNASGPVISNISPTSGAAGTSVTITGSGFDPTFADYNDNNNPNKVRFNGAQAAVTAASATSLTVTAPASSGVITVTVGSSSETPNNCPSCVTAGSSAAFNATTTLSGVAQDNAGANLSGVSVSLVETGAVIAGPTDSSGNFNNTPVPARPYFSLRFSKPGYYPTYTALMSFNAPNNGNWTVFNSLDLTNRGVLPASGKGMIVGRVQDWTDGSSKNLAGAVVTATSLIHPDVPYVVKYTNTATNVAQDPASSFTSTAASGPGFGQYYVVDVDEGDYVTVTASKAGMGFQNRIFNTHGDSVSNHSVRGATPGGPPIAAPPGGSYAATQFVTLSGGGTYDDIVYTTNGSDPTISGTTYSAPITITADSTLKFATRNKNVNQAFSPVHTEVYNIGASIAGQVTDANTSNPVQFANVQIYDQSGSFLNSTNTDSSGSYKFSGLAANTYKVCFYAGQSYISQCWQNIAANPASATSIIVAPLAQVTAISAALQTGAVISGRVTRDGVNGIQNVWINVNDTNGNQVPGIGGANTDSNGNYTLSGLPGGTYKLNFNGQSSGYLNQWYNNKADSASADPITVSAGVTYPGINAQLALGGSINGRVTNSGAAGIQNISIQLRDTNGNWIPNINGTMTDASGNYTLGGIPTGSYKLYFDGQSTGYISQWFNGVADQSAATVLAVVAGGNLTGKDAVLSQGGTISGQVTNSGASGIQNVMVQLRDTNGNWIPNIYSPMTDSSGNYTLSGVPVGNYKLYFDGQSTGYISQWYNNAADQSAATVLQVLTPGAILSGKNAVLSQGATISGTVTNGASGIQNISVQLYNNTGSMTLFNTNTDPSGVYQFTGLQAGTYRVCFSPGQTNYIAKCYNNLAYNSNTATDITVSVPGGRNDINATMTQGGGISGQVTNGSSGIPNISVEVRDTLTGNSIPGVFGMWTDFNGNYNILGVPAGNIKVYFNPNGASYAGQWYNNKPSFASSDNVAIFAGLTTSPVNAVLQPATAPGAPTIDSIIPGNGFAQVNFTAPTSDGGMPIQDYTVTVNPGGMTGFNFGSPIYVYGLTNGQNYTVSVTARNNLGNSTAASTPYSLPLFTNTGNDLQAAVSAVAANGVIWAQGPTAKLDFPPLSITKGVTISGGYSFDYSTVNGYSTITGRVNITGSGFKVIFKNVKVKAP